MLFPPIACIDFCGSSLVAEPTTGLSDCGDLHHCVLYTCLSLDSLGSALQGLAVVLQQPVLWVAVVGTQSLANTRGLPAAAFLSYLLGAL